MPQADTEIGFLNRLVSASIGSIITSLITTPLDVVKVRMQIQDRSSTNGRTINVDVCKSPENPDECEICSPNQSKSKINGKSTNNGKITNGNGKYNGNGNKLPKQQLKDFSNINLRLTVTSTTKSTTKSTTNIATNMNANANTNMNPNINPHLTENGLNKTTATTTVPPPSTTTTNKNYKTITSSKIKMNTNRFYLFSNGLMQHYLPENTIRDIADKSICRHIKFHSSFDAFRKIVRFEGISHLYTGLAVTLWMAVPATVLYYSIYDVLRNYFVTTFDNIYFQNPDTNITDKQKQLAYVVSTTLPAVAGMTGRVFAQSVISPLELLRTQMMAKTIDRKLTIIEATKANIRNGGFRSLWKGLIPTLWRDVPFSGTYWMGYELIKDYFISINNDNNLNNIDDNIDNNNNNSKFMETQFGLSFVSGALSGTFASVITQPFDVIKTRRQSALIGVDSVSNGNRAVMTESTLFGIWREIYRNEGMNGLFAGIGARTTRVPLACAVMVSTYEVGKKVLSQVND